MLPYVEIVHPWPLLVLCVAFVALAVFGLIGDTW